MKRKTIYSAILLLLSVFAVTGSFALSNPVKGQPSFSEPLMRRQGDMMVIDLSVDISNMKFKKQQMVVYTPMLLLRESNESFSSILPPLVINGRARGKALAREIRFGNARMERTPALIIRRENGLKQIVPMTISVPYEDWMMRAEVVVMEEISGCANCNIVYNEYKLKTLPGVNGATDQTLYVPSVIPNFMLTLIAPPAEDIKARSETFSALINYEVGKYDLRRGYKNNAAVLDEVDRIIRELRQDANLTVTELKVVGYASPEGGENINITLSQNRTMAFVNYLKRVHGIPENLIDSQWKGEDWAGLRKAVAESNIPEKREIIGIIDGNYDVAARKNALKRLNNGQTYRLLLNVYYPPLRRNEYTISYVARPYNVEEARRLIHTKPQQLSLSEMYMVANTYPAGSREYKDVFDIAARLFPQDLTARINAAAVDIENGAVDAGIRRLEGIRTAEAYNNMGVAYAKKGNYPLAFEYFRIASEADNLTATDNLQLLVKIMGEQ